MSTVQEWQRPPFQPGNMARLSHGARTPRVYGELAKHFAAGLLEERPDLAAYPEAVARWATAEAQATLMRRHFEDVGTIDPETGEPRSSLHWLRTFEKLAKEMAEPLGLDPVSEARLAKERAAAATLSHDLDGLMARGRAIREARENAALPDAEDVVGQVLAAARQKAEQPEGDPDGWGLL